VQNPGPNEATVRILCSPIHPVDINVAEGTYGALPPLPAVLGSEGVGVVEKLGPATSRVKKGQKVIIARPSVGTCVKVVI